MCNLRLTAINVVGLVALASAAPAQETGDRAKQAVSSALGVKETTYSDGWKRDDPITIATFKSGEACCPTLRRLPNGDLVVGVGRGGDHQFANNSGANVAWFRSRNNGVTWAPDQEFRPPYAKLFIRGGVVRSYDDYSFAIKGRTPTRYICRYAESTDGGRIFSKHGISTYDTLGRPEGESAFTAGALGLGAHNLGPYREILDEAGWKGDDCVNAPVGGITNDGLDHHGWLEMPDRSLLTCHSATKRMDCRRWNTLVSRSTDGGISWEFVARVNPERHWEFNGKHDLWDRETLTLKTQAKPTTSRGDLRKYMDVIYDLTREDLAWARPELVDGYMSGWENLAIEELPNGELLIVYDVQNWIAEPGASPRKAIRAVRMRRTDNHQ